MKKFLFLLFICLPMFALADDCSEKYRAGRSLYEAGKYAEAQRKFIDVAKTCGDYANVYRFLKECNQQLVNKQNQLVNIQREQANEIASLKAEKKKLTEELDNLKTGKAQKNVENRNAAEQVLKALKDDNNRIKDEKERVEKEIVQLQCDKDSIQKSLVDANAQIENLNKKLEHPKVQKLLKKIEKQEAKATKKQKGKNQKQELENK